MSHVVIVGCGIVGATIAYELSLVSGLSVTVLDRKPPATESTGAALGILMGVISHKVKGRAWKWRRDSLERYETLIPELETRLGRPLPFNRQGILMLGFEGENWNRWEEVAAIRRSQGLPLELLDAAAVRSRYPQIGCDRVTGAIYSPRDRQFDPTAITLALVDAARQNGVTFNFGVGADGLEVADNGNSQKVCQALKTDGGHLAADWVVVAAGVGTTSLLETASPPSPVVIRPILGRALQVRCPQPLGAVPEPVITGDDVHIAPMGGGDYWLGATVEFPDADGNLEADPELFDRVKAGAIAMCPALKDAEIVREWSGLRPRPEGRPAPVVEPLTGFQNVILATGHYRNGVLLAPATALAVRGIINN
jgi:glycine oxidase